MATKRINKKLLGDAGEHYALSQFSFSGNYAAKMPDNWEGYDLAVETGAGLVRVSVYTRCQAFGYATHRWFYWDDRKKCDWIVFIFRSDNGQLRSWVVPSAMVEEHSDKPVENLEFPWLRELKWKKLAHDILGRYEDNWSMNPDGSENDAATANGQEASPC
jgi:hypothetical protein